MAGRKRKSELCETKGSEAKREWILPRRYQELKEKGMREYLAIGVACHKK